MDTGASSTFISHDLAEKLRIPINCAPVEFSRTGLPCKSIGTVQLSIELLGRIISTTAIVVSPCEPRLIIGWNVLQSTIKLEPMNRETLPDTSSLQETVPQCENPEQEESSAERLYRILPKDLQRRLLSDKPGKALGEPAKLHIDESKPMPKIPRYGFSPRT